MLWACRQTAAEVEPAHRCEPDSSRKGPIREAQDTTIREVSLEVEPIEGE